MADTRAARCGGSGSTSISGSALGLAVLLVPISISGALLVWHDHLDALSIQSAMRYGSRACVAAVGLSGESASGGRWRSSEPRSRALARMPESRAGR